MVVISDKHDTAISLLNENDELSRKFFHKLLEDEYFFQCRTVDADEYKLMQKRKKAMQMNAAYMSALIPLGKYFEENNEPLILSQFVISGNSIMMYSNAEMTEVITWYNNPNYSKEKVIRLNEHYEEKNIGLINYEVHNHSAKNPIPTK